MLANSCDQDFRLYFGVLDRYVNFSSDHVYGPNGLYFNLMDCCNEM